MAFRWTELRFIHTTQVADLIPAAMTAEYDASLLLPVHPGRFAGMECPKVGKMRMFDIKLILILRCVGRLI